MAMVTEERSTTVFANEDDDPQMDEPARLEDPAEMEVVDPGDMGGAGLRSADERITTQYMTKYERARILGTRALQIRCSVWGWSGRAACTTYLVRSTN